MTEAAASGSKVSSSAVSAQESFEQQHLLRYQKHRISNTLLYLGLFCGDVFPYGYAALFSILKNAVVKIVAKNCNEKSISK